MHEAKQAGEDYFQMFESRGMSFFSNIFNWSDGHQDFDIAKLYEVTGGGTKNTNLGRYQKMMILLVVV